MLDDLDGTDLFNALMLLRKDDQAILVVEGETDYDLTNDFLDLGKLEIVVGYGKPSLVEAGKLAEESEYNIRFLIDADFDRLTGLMSNYGSNMLITDFYDLYMDIHFSNPSGLKRIARRYLKQSELSVDEAVEIAMEVASAIGYLRFVSIMQKYFLNVSGIPIHQLFKPELPSSINLSELVRLAIQRSVDPKGDCGTIVRQIQEAKTSLDRDVIVNSHDLLTAFSVVCQSYGTGRQGHKMDDLFELAVDANSFAVVPVIGRILTWLDGTAAA